MSEKAISPAQLERLRAAARKRNISVDELLDELARQDPQPAQDELRFPGSSILLAEAARRWGFHSGHADVSKRSREILESEFSDYLAKKRLKRDAR